MKIIILRGKQLQMWKDNREEVEKALVRTHGDVQLRSTQGKILRFLRRGDRVAPPPLPSRARILDRPTGRSISGEPLESVDVQSLPQYGLMPTHAAPPAPEPEVPGECCAWLGALPEGQHHAACSKATTTNSDAPQLLDLKTGTALRPALPDEIEASRAASEKDGVGEISVDGHACYVATAEAP